MRGHLPADSQRFEGRHLPLPQIGLPGPGKRTSGFRALDRFDRTSDRHSGDLLVEESGLDEGGLQNG